MAEPLFRTPKGTHDVLPEDHQYMTYIKKAVRHRARQAGYKRIDPPMFENRAIFERGIGQHTDIVEKELFLVSGKHGDEAEGGVEYSLRPELTAGICRSYIEHGMQQLPSPWSSMPSDSASATTGPRKGATASSTRWTWR